MARADAWAALAARQVVDACAPALPLREFATIALGRPAMLDGMRGVGEEAAVAGEFFARLDALGGFLVELLCHRRGTAHIAQPAHQHDPGDLPLADAQAVADAHL